MAIDANFYNSASAAKLGWDPTWFDAENFDEKLSKNVRKFQKDFNLKADGLVGPITYRRILTSREFMKGLDNIEKGMAKFSDTVAPGNIICGGEEVPIEWEKTVNINSSDALTLPKDCYKISDTEREPRMIVTHWDAALSADSCFNILKRRGISSHFVIDNDGTIYQMVDTNDIAWHAGSVNKHSVGIDFSNAYYTKYQKWYIKKGFGRRPVLEDSMVHGRKMKAHLGYYEVQLEAYKALVKALCTHYDIPLVCPVDQQGRYLTTIYKPAVSGKFSGIVGHLNLSKRKIDCAGLKIGKLIGEITSGTT